MQILICGSIAYDTIMVFEDRFKNHILPDRIHVLNVAFLVPEMRREFGGCATNIAYNLRLLNAEPLIMATVGNDFQPYHYRLENCSWHKPIFSRLKMLLLRRLLLPLIWMITRLLLFIRER